MEKVIESGTVLGLDLGANSVGWTLLQRDGEGAGRILDAGVRVFEEGVEGDIESGKDESRNKRRRDMRSSRRRLDRLSRRLKKTALLLHENGLLPDGNIQDDAARHELMMRMDAEIVRRYMPEATSNGDSKRRFAHVAPYWLRARALDHPLELHEFGRALYHLAHRRGFKSNRKADKQQKDGEDTGVVKKNIAELSQRMEETGARTLGEYLSRLDPEEERIRGRWTGRDMYKEEFDALWDAQAPHHPDVFTPELREQLHQAIFHQRPLKPQKELIGGCELEKGFKRAPWACLEAQRFRLLQKVNDLRIFYATGEKRPLNEEERKLLIEALDTKGDRTFTQIRKLLKLQDDAKFSHEAGGETKLPGNRVAQKLKTVFGDRWDAFSAAEQEAIVQDIVSFEKEDALARRGQNQWGLTEEAAKKFAALKFEDGYCHLSRRAIRKLLPLMQNGTPYATAADELYPERNRVPKMEQLPPLDQAPFELRNPIVQRVLAELRKVVNAIIRKHGKPDVIRLELARDLKKNKKQRAEIATRNRQNQKDREKAKQRLLKEAGIQAPKGGDVLKALLWDECNGECPFTGKRINFASLFGDAPQFDIEHIIPFSRSLDDSYLNKTLCHNEENRSVKRERTPYEAYGSEPDRWEAILHRVKKFQGKAAQAKYRQFTKQTLEDLGDFADRQLNDTKYASTVAAKYLALLYGGLWDDKGRRIHACAGQVTAMLRNAWGLNGILDDGGLKTREDHRHHAVDAAAVALATPSLVRELSRAAQDMERHGRRRLDKFMKPPWDGFLQELSETIHGVTVSHRVDRKVNGRLHEDTYYSPRYEDEEGNSWVHVRKPVANLSKGDIENIVDPVVRDAVYAALNASGYDDPKKAFASEENHPEMRAGDGRRIPIHRVRIQRKLASFPVGKGPRERHVVTDTNHHVEIVEYTDTKGQTKWEGHVVSRFKAVRRAARKEPVVKRDHGPDKRFVMSLAPGEIVRMNIDEIPCLLQMTSVSRNLEFEFKHIEDARPATVLRKTKGARVRPSLNGMRQYGTEKVTIDPLGRVHPAND